MFIGPWDQGGALQPHGIAGDRPLAAPRLEPGHRPGAARRRPFLSGRGRPPPGHAQNHPRRRDEIESFRFNTLIARLMELSTVMQKARNAGPIDAAAWDEALEALLLMAAPLAPACTEELWEHTGHSYSIHTAKWPTFDPALAKDDEVELAVQVNGKVRERITLAAGAPEADAMAAALALPKVAELAAGREPRKVIFVPDRLLNLVF